MRIGGGADGSRSVSVAAILILCAILAWLTVLLVAVGSEPEVRAPFALIVLFVGLGLPCSLALVPCVAGSSVLWWRAVSTVALSVAIALLVAVCLLTLDPSTSPIADAVTFASVSTFASVAAGSRNRKSQLIIGSLPSLAVLATVTSMVIAGIGMYVLIRDTANAHRPTYTELGVLSAHPKVIIEIANHEATRYTYRLVVAVSGKRDARTVVLPSGRQIDLTLPVRVHVGLVRVSLFRNSSTRVYRTVTFFR